MMQLIEASKTYSVVVRLLGSTVYRGDLAECLDYCRDSSFSDEFLIRCHVTVDYTVPEGDVVTAPIITITNPTLGAENRG